MASESLKSPGQVPPSVTFEVSLDISTTSTKTQAKCPGRFRRKELENPDDVKERLQKMEEKQLRAQRNKEEREAERRLRISQRQEQCRHMASKMEKLLAQDAKRHGVAGTEDIRPMSRKEAGAMIQSVQRDFQQLGVALSNDIGT